MRTLAHVVVGGLIIVLSMGLIIIGVGRVRDADAKARCQKNLKQFGMALHNYHDFDRHFPAATMLGTGLPPEKRLGWLYELVPYIESEMDPDWTKRRFEPWDTEANRQLLGQYVKFVHCPGHPDAESPDYPWLTHYVGFTGIGKDAATLEKGDTKCGFFGYDRSISIIPDWVDGTSNTVIVTETTRQNGPWIAGGYASARGLEMDWQPIIGKGAQFGGCHRGGAMMLFGDTSVRFIRDTIQPSTLAALITIAGRDEPGPFDADEFYKPGMDR